MKAILLVDHGSRKREANDMLVCMANLVQAMAGRDVIVRHAHMELADPTIAAGIDDCVRAGASDITVFPYMLSPGRHSTSDIPKMVSDAAREHPGVSCTTVAAFGVHEKLGEVVLLRAGIPIDSEFLNVDADRCWDPGCSGRLCGDACRAHAMEPVVASGTERDTAKSNSVSKA